jgi:hypothetical protein
LRGHNPHAVLACAAGEPLPPRAAEGAPQGRVSPPPHVSRHARCSRLPRRRPAGRARSLRSPGLYTRRPQQPLICRCRLCPAVLAGARRRRLPPAPPRRRRRSPRPSRSQSQRRPRPTLRVRPRPTGAGARRRPRLAAERD